MDKTFASKEQKFIQLRYNVVDGKVLTLGEIAQQMEMTYEQAKQMDKWVVDKKKGSHLRDKSEDYSHLPPKNNFLQKAKAVVFGHAVGDALGVPVEFCARSELDANPVVDMRGFGSYPVPAGAWSDDTSMSLCALATMTGDKLDFNAVMLNFVRWYYRDDFTPTGLCFDVGNTCSIAIENWLIKKMSYKKCGPKDEYSNGNGSLMRIHPFVLYTYRLETDDDTKIKLVEMASALTHAHTRSKIACGIYAFVLWELLDNPCHDSILIGLEKARAYYWQRPDCAKELKHYDRLFDKIMHGQATRDEIKSGGYVVDSLEAAIWCLVGTKSYCECVLAAVNLGDDTDTVGAIAGGLAGALYGCDRIPKEWKQTLLRSDFIRQLCEDAFGQK